LAESFPDSVKMIMADICDGLIIIRTRQLSKRTFDLEFWYA